MSGAEVRSTAFDLAFPRRPASSQSRIWPFARSRPTGEVQQGPEDPDFRLPDRTSLVIVLLMSGLLQISFFIVVSSSNAYVQHLGGTSTFSGLVIGIPTAFSGLALLPLIKLDQGGYRIPLHFGCASSMMDHILYALAYRVNWLYLILIGRIVSGFGFTFWMYSKRYCSDNRVVGIRRRTTLAGWMVVGQGIGFSFGPFVGGLLYKMGFSNSVFNGFTSPAWIMAAVWAAFWLFAGLNFKDVPRTPPTSTSDMELITVQPSQLTPQAEVNAGKSHDSLEPESQTQVTEVANIESVAAVPLHRMTAPQWGVLATMCWFSMTCFFILGAWESNIPVFTGSASPLNPFDFSPFAAGNLIALGGACTFPFLFANVFLAKRHQDRNTLAIGSAVGVVGLFIALAVLRTRTVNYGSFFVCWFLVALGFNLCSTVTMSLLSKQLPPQWNTRTSMAIQYSNYVGRVTGAVWGGAGVKVGMLNYVGMQIVIVGIGCVMFCTLWRNLKAKTG